jgi:hypothetical protein
MFRKLTKPFFFLPIMTYFRTKFFGPLLQDDEIFMDVTQKAMGAKQLFNACSGLPTHRHNYLKMLEFANKKISKSTPLLSRLGMLVRLGKLTLSIPCDAGMSPHI